MCELLPVLATGVFFVSLSLAGATVEVDDGQPVDERSLGDTELSEATFAGGCFWCTEAVFEGRDGVRSVVSGFTGGSRKNATYSTVVAGGTDHRESVRVRYNPSKIGYDRLLDIYWRSIDPTDGEGQFTDRGYQYTTAIYYHSEEQRRLALESRRNVSEGLEEPVQTEVLNLSEFFPAADRHQNYSRRNSVRYEAYKRGSGRSNVLGSLWDESSFR